MHISASLQTQPPGVSTIDYRLAIIDLQSSSCNHASQYILGRVCFRHRVGSGLAGAQCYSFGESLQQPHPRFDVIP